MKTELIDFKDFPGGEQGQIFHLTFGRARLYIGKVGDMWFRDGW